MRQFLRKYTFTIIFFLLNVFMWAVSVRYPADEEPWYISVVHAPGSLVEYAVTSVCGHAFDQATYMQCADYPEWVSVVLFYSMMFAVIGSIGCITFIGLLIDWSRKKYAY